MSDRTRLRPRSGRQVALQGGHKGAFKRCSDTEPKQISAQDWAADKALSPAWEQERGGGSWDVMSAVKASST